jgi:acyl carrier protein
MSQIEQDLREFVIDTFLFGNEDAKLSNDDSFVEMGVIDSMGILNLVSFVETRYGVEVANADLVPEIWDSVGRIARFVTSKETMTPVQADSACAG